MTDINETIRLAELGAQALDDHLPSCCKRAAAIRALIALHTPKDRPDKPGEYVVGFANSPIRRVVTVSANLLVADSDYPVGRTVEEYGAAWYLGPMETP